MNNSLPSINPNDVDFSNVGGLNDSFPINNGFPMGRPQTGQVYNQGLNS